MKDERWIEPLSKHARRTPWRFDGRWFEDNADEFRHVHCVHYEKCLTVACEECKSSETWACPASCPGRLTYVEFESVRLSDERSASGLRRHESTLT